MDKEKTGESASFRELAKEVFRAFAYGGTAPGTRRPRVGLALAGGFARGIAHIGVLRVFREAAIPIDVVSGTSVGALIAAGHCAGNEIQRFWPVDSFLAGTGDESPSGKLSLAGDTGEKV